jgi:hypothetical protein
MIPRMSFDPLRDPSIRSPISPPLRVGAPRGITWKSRDQIEIVTTLFIGPRGMQEDLHVKVKDEILPVMARSTRRTKQYAKRRVVRARRRLKYRRTKRYQISSGLSRGAALRRVLRKHRHDYRGFKYDRRTGWASIT